MFYTQKFCILTKPGGKVGNWPEHEGGLADPRLAEHQHLQADLVDIKVKNLREKNTAGQSTKADQALQDLQQGDVRDRLSKTLAPEQILRSWNRRTEEP